MTVEFELDGQRFTALNGGPDFMFNEAISFQVNCKDQDEVDAYWNAFADGGEEGPCRGSRTGSASRGGSSRTGCRAAHRPRPPARAAGDDGDVEMRQLEIDKLEQAAAAA